MDNTPTNLDTSHSQDTKPSTIFSGGGGASWLGARSVGRLSGTLASRKQPSEDNCRPGSSAAWLKAIQRTGCWRILMLCWQWRRIDGLSPGVDAGQDRAAQVNASDGTKE